MEFYDKFLNFLKCTSLYMIGNNNLWSYFEGGEESVFPYQESRTGISFLSLLLHYQMVDKQGSKYVFKSDFALMSNSDKQALVTLFANEKHVKVENKKLQVLIDDFIFIRQLTQLYRNTEAPEANITNRDVWQGLMNNHQLDYELRLCETLYELRKLKLGTKIKSIFDGSYYTGSGESAFRNFTRPKFVKILETVAGNKTDFNALDIGCGYGDYIEALLEVNKNASVTGIELQPEVAKSTQQRFSKVEKVTILPSNVFEHHTERKYNIVLLNYVLFYFSTSDKHQLFSKINAMLADDGVVLVCQYFPLIEPLKHSLAKREGNYGLANQIEQYYSNKILYANTLWNDAVDTFVQSEQWGEFRQIAGECGFKVEALTYADKFYYSLFILLKKNKI